MKTKHLKVIESVKELGTTNYVFKLKDLVFDLTNFKRHYFDNEEGCLDMDTKCHNLFFKGENSNYRLEYDVETKCLDICFSNGENSLLVKFKYYRGKFIQKDTYSTTIILESNTNVSGMSYHSFGKEIARLALLRIIKLTSEETFYALVNSFITKKGVIKLTNYE